MIVLGISDSFTSGAAIVIDGKIAAAVNEERLNRNKMCMGFPTQSVAEVLRLTNVRPEDLDSVAVATETLFWRSNSVPYTDYFREKKGDTRDFYLALGAKFSMVAGNFNLARKTYYNIKKIITNDRHRKLKNKLSSDFGILKPAKFYDHHLCHAASAYFTSGFHKATVITQDGAGDGKCSRVYRVENGLFKQLQMLDSYDSIGNYYSYITHLCGFSAHKHEGKITGLAAIGKPVYLDRLRRFVSYAEGVIRNHGKSFNHTAIAKLKKELPADFSPADLSASIQMLLEESITQFCDYWIKKSGFSNLAIAGGVFANVKLNQRIHELDCVNQMFIHPGMGDDGLAAGAALFEDNLISGYRHQPVISNAYFGGEITTADIEKSLRAHGLKAVQLNGSLEHAVAKLLAAGKIVARFDGPMEYGPRALGNRTILYQPTDPSVNDWLNRRLVRTEFMPFAPVTLWEERHKCYHHVDGAEDAARFMTITFDCTEYMKKSCPAVCHVDGTARPQIIQENNNPSYYGILKKYQEITGLSSLINTSFNMHEEPIVNTPDDAIRSFKRGHLDYLAIGKFLIRNDNNA